MGKGLPKTMAQVRRSRTQAINLGDYADAGKLAEFTAAATTAGVTDANAAAQIGQARYETWMLQRALYFAGILNLPPTQESQQSS